MPLTPGTTLGPYEILGAVGAGGMGEVYRARDTRLDRTVAVKVLSAKLAERPDLRKRFEREARTISKLTHPHVCALYDVGQQEGVDFLVMEYLEGETLGHRLQRGPLPPDQTLKHGTEIAEALEAAHRQGIIHRDLKPGNVMLTKSGVKLMDFGLAKLAEQPTPVAVALSEMTTAATLPSEEKSLTEEGVIVGTFQYMAPEQLEGKEADARTDLFALGMVLYEMATGRPAFTGKTKASVIAAILSSEPPPISTLQPLTPPAFDRVVKTCLAKDPDERWQSAHDLASELKWIAEGGSQAGVAAPVVARRKHRERWAWGLAALLGAAGITATVGYVMRAPKAETVVRFDLAPPPQHSFTAQPDDWIFLGISPDSRSLAFQASDASGKWALWVRPLDSVAARELVSLDLPSGFIWAPDSRALFFVREGKMHRVAVTGGPPEVVCPVWPFAAPVPNREGTFLANSASASGNLGGPLVRFTADNCTGVEVTTLDRSRHFAHAWPYFLPDDRHFLYVALAANKNHEIWAGSLDSKDGKLVLRNASQPFYAEPGYLLFERHGILTAQRFDWKSLKLSGEPVQLVPEQLQFADLFGVANFDVSQTGVLAYQSQPEQRRQLVWYDHSGKALGAAVKEPGFFGEIQISPDGRRIVAQRFDPQTHLGDLSRYDFDRAAWTRLTFSATPGGKVAIWSPDGSRLLYRSFAAGRTLADLFIISAEGGPEELVLHSDYDKVPMDWSRDGQWVLFENDDRDTLADLWVLDMRSRQARALVRAPGSQVNARFSPDGRWVAYQSDESGQPEVYAVPLAGGAKLQISAGGGSAPQWQRDGRRIYYLSSDWKVMAADVTLDGSARVSRPLALFSLPPGSEYHLAPDGRILADLPLTSAEEDRIHVVVNWMAEIK